MGQDSVDMMRAWRVTTPGSVDGEPLEMVQVPIPQPGPGEVRLKVLACGVCRTDLHVTEGDLPVHREHVIPGHEIVGVVDKLGAGVPSALLDQRRGAAWLRHTDGTCKYCQRGNENLCPNSLYTGWDADGGYAEYAVAPADFLYELPTGYSDLQLGPLLCAGIIGYRSLARADLPKDGALGIYGFGGSAHLIAQVALGRGARFHVMSRGAASRKLATQLGASSTQGFYDSPPEKLDAAILFAPVGDVVPNVMEALDRGGTLSIAGIHLTDVPQLNYVNALFYERQIRSVTSNTRQDGREFLSAAQEHHLAVDTHEYLLDNALQALRDLKHGRFTGAAVLVP